jgi:tryptophan synthase alpha chain
MKNRIDLLFEQKQKDILSIFLTAGFPKRNDTLPIIELLSNANVDLVEIGIPFSDPLADGPIIQNSSLVALNNGMSLKGLFADLTNLRSKTEMPILLMGYLNSVLQFGIEDFYKACNSTGVDGVILPDLSCEEYERFHKNIAQKHNIHVVFLISPDTSIERIHKIDSLSKGFIYLVSNNSTTGNFYSNKTVLDDRISNIMNLKLTNPILIGFGIKGNKEFRAASNLANGAILGSSFIQLLEKSTNLNKDIPKFITSILSPLNSSAS